MSAIAGIINQNGGEVSARLQSLVHTLQQTKNGECWIVSNNRAKKYLDKAQAVGNRALVQISWDKNNQPARPGFGCGGNIAVLYDGTLYNSQELLSTISTEHKINSASAADIVAHLLEKYYSSDLIAALKQVVPMLDGDYCLAVGDNHRTAIMRDTVGMRPAFFAANEDLMAFASTKKALWRMGLRNVKPVRAGKIVSFGDGGVNIQDMYSLRQSPIKADKVNLKTAVTDYCDLLRNAVEKRIGDLKKVGVLISGGVDSCLIGKLVTDVASDKGIEVTAYTAGKRDTNDIKYARKFTRNLGLKHRVREIDDRDIESFIPLVIEAVEERDMVQVEAGVGIYAALEMASQDSIYNIFSGQGPDELWGGYSWYPQLVAAEGYESLQEQMWNDLERSDIETLDRENKIAFAHGVEQVFPYCDTEVVKLAMSIPPDLKVTSAEDTVGKHPHRVAAIELGVPQEFAYRGKNAAQHSTGVHSVLDSIARNHGFTPDVAKHAGYDTDLVGGEKLASSTRYGYRYDDPELWQIPGHIQFYLDSIAYRKGLLNKDERSAVVRFLKEAGIQS